MTDQPAQPDQTMADEVFNAELEEGGESALERAGRFATGVLTSALGGSGAAVVGASVVVRRREDEKEVLRIDVPDAESGDQVLQAMREDLRTYPADEFVTVWVEREQTRHGRHSAPGGDHGTRLE